MWEEIRLYMATCKDELTEQADEWMGKIIKKLEKRKELKTSVLNPRYKRIKTMIHDVRLEELESHKKLIQKIENVSFCYL